MKTISLLLLAVFGCTLLFAQSPPTRVPDAEAPDPGSAWYYYENRGQIIDEAQNIRNDIKYYTTHPGVKIYLGDDTISFTGRNAAIVNDTLVTDTSFRVDMQFYCGQRDANQPCPNTIGVYEASGDSLNYYLPHCSSGIEGVPGFGGVVYQNAFPNTDVHFFSNPEGPLTYFVLHPSADTNAFTLQFLGQDSIQAIANYLHIYSGQHGISFPDGIAYQVDPFGAIVPLGWMPTWYDAGNGKVKMHFGSYNPSYDLVIRTGAVGQKTAGQGTDNLTWTTYYGDAGGEANPDSSREWSVDGMPIIKSALQHGERIFWHAMTSKSTAFNLYSGNRVTTSGLFAYKGDFDCIVSAFDGDTCRRLWSTYFGGSSYEEVAAMLILDANQTNNNSYGNLILAGRTRSNDIPLGIWHSSVLWKKSTNIPSTGLHTGSFIASFGASNGYFKYSTYFGGGSFCYLDALAWDEAKQEIVFCGYIDGSWAKVDTTSQNPGGDTISLRRGGRYFQSSTPDARSGFVGAFNLGRDLTWCTLIGGDSLDVMNVIVPDKSGGLYVLGNTRSRSGSVTVSTTPLFAPVGTGAAVSLPFVDPGAGAFSQTSMRWRRGFLAHFNSARAIDWGTLYGGGTDNEYLGLVVNSKNDVYISGTANRADTIHSNQADNSGTYRIPSYAAIGGSYLQGYGTVNFGQNGGQDAVIARFDSTHKLKWSTLFGLKGIERAPIRLVIDSLDHIYMSGNNEIDTGAGAGAQSIPIYKVTGRYQQDSNASSRSLLTPSTINSGLEVSDGWIVQFNPANRPVWSTLYGGVFPGNHPISGGNLSFVSGNYQDAREIITSMDAVTKNGLVSLYMTGITKNPNTPMYFSNSSRRKPFAIAYDDATHGGNWDSFIGMFENARATAVPSVPQLHTSNNIMVAPNPSHDRFAVTFNNEGKSSRVPMVVTSALGQVLLSGNINAVRGENKFMLDLEQLPAGVYFLQLASEEKSEAVRMVKY